MSANTQRFDFLVRASEKTFGVEIRLGNRIRFDAFAQSMNLLLQTTATPIDGVLVVVNSSPECNRQSSRRGQRTYPRSLAVCGLENQRRPARAP